MATITKYQGKRGISWQVKIRRQGAWQSASFKTRKEAEDWSRNIENQIVRAKYYPDETQKPTAHTTGELIDVYMQRSLSLKAKKTQVNHGRCLTWWKGILGDTTLTNVTPALLEDCIQLLRNKGFSAAYINMHIDALSPAFTLATSPRLAWAGVNPFTHVKRLQTPPERAPMLTPIQVEQLLECCDISKSKHLPLYARLSLATGGRKQEILTLTWGQISFRNKSVTFRQTKGRRQRTVPLPDMIVLLLKKVYDERFPEDYLADVDRADMYLFPSERDPDKPRREIHIAFANARARCNLEWFRPHDQRHHFASSLLMDGQADILMVSRLLGHADLKQTSRYTHLTTDYVADHVQRMADAMFRNKKE